MLSGETVHAIAGAVGIDSGGEPVDVSRERHLQQLLSAGLGGGQARRFLTVDFTTLNGNEICALSVRPADAPVYLRDGAEPRLYVRTGNATTPLPLDDAVQYVGSRWPCRTTGHLLDALLGRHT